MAPDRAGPWFGDPTVRIANPTTRRALPEAGTTRDNVDQIAATDLERNSASLWRGLPRSVWAAWFLWVAVLLAWSTVLPTFRSADEVLHVTGVLKLEHHQEWPGYKGLRLDEGARVASHGGGYLKRPPAPYPPLHADDAKPRHTRRSFDQMGAGTDSKGTATIGQHPPGYYALLAVLASVLPSSTSADLEVWFLRLVSALLMAPIPLVLAAATRRLGGTEPVIVTASVLPLVVPQLAATGGAVNNDNLVNGAAAWVTLGVVLVSTGDLRKRVAGLTGLALAAALMAKAFALVLVPFVIGAYLLSARRTRRLLSSLKACGVALAAAMAGGWWWVYSYLRYGQIQPSGHVAIREEGRLGLVETAGDYWSSFAAMMPGRFWAALSISGPRRVGEGPALAFPWIVGVALSLLLIAALVAAVQRPRHGPLTRSSVLLLLWPFLSLAVILTVSTWNILARTGRPSGLQGRYLFAGLPGVFIVLAFLLVHRVGSKATNVVPTSVTAFGLAFTAASFERVIRFHYGADHVSLAGAPRALIAWSPLPTPVLAAIGLVVVVSAWVLVKCTIASARGTDLASDPTRALDCSPDLASDPGTYFDQ